MKTKIIFALVTVAALAVLATGIVLAHNTPIPTAPYHDQYAPDQDDYGWGCYGYNQPYYQYPPANDTAQQPQTPVQPDQASQGYYYPPRYPDEGYYPRGYGRGCWGW